MNSIELARQLGAAIQAEGAYKRYRTAKEANDSNDELQQEISSFEAARMALNTAMSCDKSETPEEKELIEKLSRDMRAEYTKVMQNPLMIEYQDAKAELDEAVGAINSIISMSVNGEDPMTCQPQTGCGGGCSSCSGCG